MLLGCVAQEMMDFTDGSYFMLLDHSERKQNTRRHFSTVMKARLVLLSVAHVSLLQRPRTNRFSYLFAEKHQRDGIQSGNETGSVARYSDTGRFSRHRARENRSRVSMNHVSRR